MIAESSKKTRKYTAVSTPYPHVHTPAISTMQALLDRRGLVERRRAAANEALPVLPWSRPHVGDATS